MSLSFEDTRDLRRAMAVERGERKIVREVGNGWGLGGVALNSKVVFVGLGVESLSNEFMNFVSNGRSLF